MNFKYLKNTKLAYQSGKGTSHLVPVILPHHTIAPLKILSSKEVREKLTLSTNEFLFPFLKSASFVSSWHAFNTIVKKSQITNINLMTATSNRHRIATLFAKLDMNEIERKYIYDHFGHSESINKNIYQAPPALKELLIVGKALGNLDEDKMHPINDNNSEIEDNNELNISYQTDSDKESGTPQRFKKTEDVTSIKLKKQTKNICNKDYFKWTKDTILWIRNEFKDYYMGTASTKHPSKEYLFLDIINIKYVLIFIVNGIKFTFFL